MIAGTLILEDKVLHFRAGGAGRVEYTVGDPYMGLDETVQCDYEHFVDALRIALRPDEEPSIERTEVQWDHARRAQPEDPDLRWIP